MSSSTDKESRTTNRGSAAPVAAGVNPFPLPSDSGPQTGAPRQTAPLHPESKMPVPATAGLGVSTSNQSPEASIAPFAT